MTEPFNMDFIIVGAMKSGTTSLIYHLSRHPEICIPRGELHFFENDQNYPKGLEWYVSRVRRHETPRTRVYGEKTTAYSFHKDVPARIHAAFPNTRLVWILREPVARAYSNYLHAYRMGAVRGTFEEAVENEAERMKESIYFGYMERSRYASQVKRYLEHFGRERMHFILFEDFIRNVRETLTALFDFIGVTADDFEFRDEPRGRAVMPRWPASIYHTRRLFGPGLVHKAVLFANTMLKKPGYEKLDAVYKAELKARFAEDNAALAELTGLDLSSWA
jgi:hypothetical protein